MFHLDSNVTIYAYSPRCKLSIPADAGHWIDALEEDAHCLRPVVVRAFPHLDGGLSCKSLQRAEDVLPQGQREVIREHLIHGRQLWRNKGDVTFNGAGDIPPPAGGGGRSFRAIIRIDVRRI
jgi:hypothetical protein